MDKVKVSKLLGDLIKDYERIENYNILICSQDKERDFRLLANKMKSYRERLNILLLNEHTGIEQAGACTGKGNLQKESI